MPQTPEGRLARIEEMGARLDERTASIIREIDRISRDLDTLGPIGGQVIELLAEVRANAEDFAALREELDAEREQERQERENELKQLRDARGMSPALKVALISAGGAIIVAIITALVGGR